MEKGDFAFADVLDLHTCWMDECVQVATVTVRVSIVFCVCRVCEEESLSLLSTNGSDTHSSYYVISLGHHEIVVTASPERAPTLDDPPAHGRRLIIRRRAP